MSPSNNSFHLKKIYDRLYAQFGPQHWWPGDSTFEIIVGAILTQNTNWKNVEKALANLKKANLLTPAALRKISKINLARLIKPSGFFNIKAQRLKNFIEFLYREYKGSMNRMAKEPTDVARKKILSVNGIGPETADSILLYALDKPVFVVDAYTKRILYRHNFLEAGADYAATQKIFAAQLKPQAQIFNEFHALIVKLGKDFCKTKPLCHLCPLNAIQYSLTYKCARCHRYLPDAQKSSQDKNSKSRFCKACA